MACVVRNLADPRIGLEVYVPRARCPPWGTDGTAAAILNAGAPITRLLHNLCITVAKSP